MITESYVSFEIAKLLKEKGFDCKKTSITAMYNENGEFYSLSSAEPNYFDYNDFDEYDYIAPTLQMTMKWLREVHNIAICICAYYSDNPYELNYRDNKPYWKIRIMNHIFSRDYDSFNTYEEACEAAIKYCLKNLI